MQIVIGFIFLALSCNKNEYELDNKNHNTMMILGHRGMGELYKYPGNTLESIVPVINIGADGSELDIQITKDSVVVLFHDNTMDFLTNCEGYIYDQEWSEINTCNYMAIAPSIKVISLDELFSKIENVEEYYFSLDCKLDKRYEGNEDYQKLFLRSIKRIIDKYRFDKHIILEGGETFLINAQKLNLNVECFLTHGQKNENKVAIANKNNFRGIGVDANNISEELVKDAHKNQLYVMCWSIKNALDNNSAFSKNVDIIQTDAPIHILQQLDRYNYEYLIP